MFSLMFSYFQESVNSNNIYSFLISFLISWHMYQIGFMYKTGWNLILFLLSYFLLKTVSVMNKPHFHKKIVTCLTKTLKGLSITLYTSSCSQMFNKILGVLKGVLKNLANFTENTCAGYNVNVNIWVYAFSLYLNLKIITEHSCFPVRSAEVLGRPFF